MMRRQPVKNEGKKVREKSGENCEEESRKRSRMDEYRRRRREGFPASFSRHRRDPIVETMRTFPLPRPKCSFPFPMRLFFSLPRPSRPPRCRSDSSFSPSRYLRLIPCMHPSFLVHLRASVERSQFITVLEYGFRDGETGLTRHPDLTWLG